jgi:hypothetical protein
VHAFRDFVRELASRHPNLSVHCPYNEATEEDRTMHWHHCEGLIDAELLEEMLLNVTQTITFADRSRSWSAFITTFRHEGLSLGRLKRAASKRA